MISVPPFLATLPQPFQWLETFEWSADSCFSGYLRLLEVSKIATSENEETTSNFGCYALGRWLNKLLIDLFDNDIEKTAFVDKYPPGSVKNEELQAFQAFILGARRTVLSGLINDGFEWELCDQTELSRRWPSEWYAAHLVHAMDSGLADMHIYTVPFYQDYTDGLSYHHQFFQQCIQQIEDMANGADKAKMLLAIIVNRPMPVKNKVELVDCVVRRDNEQDGLWSWIGHYLVAGHVGDSAFKAAYEQLAKALIAPSNPMCGGNLQHPALLYTMDALERFNEIEHDSAFPLIGSSEIDRLGWVILNSATTDDSHLSFIMNMKLLESEPWDVLRALLAKKGQGSSSDSLVELPDILV